MFGLGLTTDDATYAKHKVVARMLADVIDSIHAIARHTGILVGIKPNR